MKIVDIQQELAKLGFRPGPLDGIYGRQTVAAVKAFQLQKGLEPDGIVGPLTLEALLPGTKPGQGLQNEKLVWFKEAQRLLGVQEARQGSNQEILNWATELGIPYKSDDIPWCGLFVAHCIGATLEREPLPGNPLGARAWGRFGIPTKPTLGAVMVFWRKSKQSGLGHVGFYAGEDKSAYRILGGNQSDKVSLAWVLKDRLVEARWPSTVPAVAPEILQAKRDERLSWNEA